MSQILSRVCMDNIVDMANALQSSIYTSIQYYIIPTNKIWPLPLLLPLSQAPQDRVVQHRDPEHHRRGDKRGVRDKTNWQKFQAKELK